MIKGDTRNLDYSSCVLELTAGADLGLSQVW